MGKDAEYWKKRFLALEDVEYKNGEKYYRDLQKQFRIAQNSIILDIEHWYQRIADNNSISLAAAKRLLKSNELEEFKWNVEQYIKIGKENDVNHRWMKQLENASARHHISYLEAMKMQIQQHCELLSVQYENGLTDFLNNQYSERFYHTAFECQKGKGVYSNFARIDTNKLDKVLTTPWAADGKNFSDRIWSNKGKLVNELHTELSQCLIRGESPQKAAERLAKTMGVNESQARRIVMTEMAAISSHATLDSFMKLGVEKYIIIATLDMLTSDICREMDGKTFDVKDFEIGVTAPPFHPNCRSDVAPDDEDVADSGTRIARNEEGKTYYVSADMTYKKWKESFVDILEKSDIIKAIKIPKKMKSVAGVTLNMLNSMQKGIDTIEREYNIHLSKILVEDMSAEKPDTPYLCRYTDNNGKHQAVFVLNSGFDFTGFEDVVAEGYRVGYFAGKTVEDHIIHEMAHVMTGQHIQNADEFTTFMKMIEDAYVPGVSGYSDMTEDGFETIAEAFVRIRNGEEVPEKARKLVETYIERWRK